MQSDEDLDDIDGDKAAPAVTSESLMSDYERAYHAMKEQMEIRLRHESRRADFMQVMLSSCSGWQDHKSSCSV